MNYLISFIYNKSILYCIWVSEDEDYVITKEDKILFFNTIDELSFYERQNNIVSEKSEEIQYNLDKMILWCDDEKNIDCGCDEILNFWNICSDIAKSIKKHFIGNESIYDDLYEKIFNANDLFSTNSVPHTTLLGFSVEDIISVKRILRNGIEIIVENI